jgi:RimJ/RimL family protein N-acetyltransferase
MIPVIFWKMLQKSYRDHETKATEACRAEVHTRLVERFATARLIVRDWAVADAPAAFAIYGRDEVMRWLGARPRSPVASLDEMRERIARWQANAAAEPGFGLWAIETRGSGLPIGSVLLSPLPGGDGEVETGWHLNPDHWGNGYATEAARGALDLAFESLGLDQVVAVVDTGNSRSAAVCGRLGMSHLGQTSRYYGETLELFRIERAAWIPRNTRES